MPIFRISNKYLFLEHIVQYIIEIYNRRSIQRCKLLVPNGTLCRVLQESLITKLGKALLPEIISINEMQIYDKQVYEKKSSMMNIFDEKLLLAKIIKSYKKFDYNAVQATSCSKDLYNLFYILESNNINIQEIKYAQNLEQSTHWKSICDFLSFAYLKWKNYLEFDNKFSKAEYQTSVFQSEINNLKNNSEYQLIIIVSNNNNQLLYEFIRNLLPLKNALIILSPTYNQEKLDNYSLNLSPKEAVFSLGNLLTYLNITFKSIPIVDNLQISDIRKNSSNMLPNSINYIEFSDLFIESEYIANSCFSRLKQNPQMKIAIIIHNSDTKDFYTMFLTKYFLQYHDLIGTALLKSQAGSLFIIISELLFTDFDLRKFLNLLTHPFIVSDYTKVIFNILNKNHYQFVDNLQKLEELLLDELQKSDFSIFQYSDVEKEFLISWLNKIFNLFKNKVHSKEFKSILKYVMHIAETLYNDFWEYHHNCNLSEVISEILYSKEILYIDDLHFFIQIFKNILEEYRVFNSDTKHCNIILCKLEDVSLINFDLMIIPDLHDISYPLTSDSNCWLNSKIQEKLSIYNWEAKIGNSLNNFYLNLYNKEVILTRSKKYIKGTIVNPSPLLLMLQKEFQDSLIKINAISQPAVFIKDKYQLCNFYNDSYVISQIDFPHTISATDIEMLMRSPYNFYMKKILRIQPQENFTNKNKFNIFGNIFHKILDKYNRSYINADLNKQIENFKFISYKVIHSMNLSQTQTEIFKLKINAISEEIVIFDYNRRKNNKVILTELPGVMQLKIMDVLINIKSIADRIEIDGDNNATIIDYKTGSIPTKKDINSGLSNQLIIEALIMLEKGFQFNINSVKSLVYIKINSSKPYLTEINIPISYQKLLLHKEGLRNLITYYYTEKRYPITPNILKYDNYSHVARRYLY
ncbi:PD-(D/E)XK nuclease family protein [Rickettsia endosymbiont of Cardiosporidium cionae]|uniref:PD-(D/E)XK nuclease family protein n=1 Tax=Rickettsia endosymbiont of Cardiosporidium cionae TaxID=2777155 RepID=UPI001893EC3C|nr:PD-(D/E)XK nuclease family protein [Rickettsia endosymbiont of Cardiosporidium cionae]KAF8818884.1 hypothetical protein IHI24_000118 [Rickettsia endosymbiont of Cardiosporidium cionae]